MSTSRVKLEDVKSRECLGLLLVLSTVVDGEGQGDVAVGVLLLASEEYVGTV